MSNAARGVLYVHSAPSALCPHVEWAVVDALGVPTPLPWRPQPAEPGTYRAEVTWRHEVGSAAACASRMRGWERVRFEITEEPTATTEGARYSYTPSLGIFHAAVGQHGDVVVHEDRLRAATARAAAGEGSLAEEIDALLGRRWDDELEVFRHAGEGAPVRWLNQVG
ncbi:uncharacterized protein DUF3145 [Mumia flava]|uniref:Uncharacterized protein DUF3145 n=1 Tax=Mumia flava TaxID=1348852 RepID=A0A0B2BAQ6_9ACTN|nr:DUF3145 domain-containing protein [Mumia flava]PJJ53834.1 uncharacterized protein DUF3145 [Mumia flava]